MRRTISLPESTDASTHAAVMLAIDRIARPIQEDLEAILVAGSAASHRSQRPTDVDLIFVVQGEWHQRQCFSTMDGLPVDLFVFPMRFIESQVTARGNPFLVRALADGLVLWDPSNRLPPLVRAARQLITGAYEYSAEQNFMLRLRTRRLYLAAENAAALNSPEMDYFLALLVHSVANGESIVAQRWSVGEKHALRDMYTHRPDVVQPLLSMLDTFAFAPHQRHAQQDRAPQHTTLSGDCGQSSRHLRSTQVAAAR